MMRTPFLFHRHPYLRTYSCLAQRLRKCIGPSNELFPYDGYSRLKIPAHFIVALLSRLRLQPDHPVPISLFNHVNDTLLTLYPPQEDLLLDVLPLFKYLTDLILNIAQGHLMDVIVQLSQGFIVWFHNDCESISDNIFNDTVSFSTHL